jgi:hypothetical protein
MYGLVLAAMKFADSAMPSDSIMDSFRNDIIPLATNRITFHLPVRGLAALGGLL